MKEPKTIDEYLETVDAVKRQALEKLRATIRRIVPRAEECISYGVPCFRVGGKALVGFGAAKNHCSFYPWSGKTVEEFSQELKEFQTSKGAIRFQPEKPLPAALIRKMVKSRMAQQSKPL